MWLWRDVASGWVALVGGKPAGGWVGRLAGQGASMATVRAHILTATYTNAEPPSLRTIQRWHHQRRWALPPPPPAKPA